ncbi:hypothetical protein FJZ31_12125 [Candidatus Poribacteria bacterium]|nr:hypothetical protein [Candidatus Poribacteria bacterium]
MIEITLGFILGIIASFFAWLIVSRFIIPSLIFFPNIYKEISDENPSGYRYLIRFKNKGSRNIIDLELIAKLRIKGLYEHKKSAWKAIYIPIDDNRIPTIGIQKKYKRTVVQLCISKITDEAKASLPENLQIKVETGKITLEELLNLGVETNLQLFIFGYDSFSGSRKLFESKLFTVNDIIKE